VKWDMVSRFIDFSGKIFAFKLRSVSWRIILLVDPCSGRVRDGRMYRINAGTVYIYNRLIKLCTPKKAEVS
jgi:hypothetical protein